MNAVLTEGIANEAITMALPMLRQISSRYTWGPRGVVIMVGGNGLATPLTRVMWEELGPKATWAERYEGCDFEKIASEKLQETLRTGLPSSVIVQQMPYRLRSGDSLYGGAVAKDTDLAVSVSGLYEDMDETCGWIIWDAIVGLCKRAVKDLQKKNIDHL